MPTAVAIQCVVVTTPNVPSISGRVVKVLGLILVMNNLLLRSDIRVAPPITRPYCAHEPAHRECIGPQPALPVGANGSATRQTLKVGLAGLGAVGLGVARRLETGIPGLGLAAICRAR